MSKKLNDIKNTGFKVPKNYFDTLENAVLKKIETSNSLYNLDDPGFTIPENYLDNIEDRVMSKITTEESKVISLFTKQHLIYLSGIAAAIVLFFAIYLNKNSTIDSLELAPELVENYIIDQDVSTYELATLLTEDEILSINLDIMDEAFTDDDMENYLLKNINIEDIIEY